MDQQDIMDESDSRNYLASEAFKYGKILASPLPGDEVVISGISGTFPDSQNVYLFRDNLYNKVDMVSSDNRRWPDEYPNIPHRTGKIFDVEKLDAGFFGLHYRQAESLDPLARLVLERAMEAILDAGINLLELEGTNTGVYVGACVSESEIKWCSQSLKMQYYIITGHLRSMIANRVSYYLKLKGPSHIVDTACSSSFYALERAYQDIRTGKVDTAIVAGSTLTLHPMVSLQFARMGVLSEDGTCKVFDERSDGYARSEAVVCVVLQKMKNCRRNYAEIVYAKTNSDGFKPQSITYPSGESQQQLLQEFYKDCAVNPTTLSFVEAHGTGTVVGDPEELKAIDGVFCKNRTTPLLIGSVKSNIGHTEPSSGLCSIAKVIIAMENGAIPPNIHYQIPRKEVEALEKGRMKVVTEKTPLQDDQGLIGVNCFGFGGSNGHVLLRWNQKNKHNRGSPKDELPRLVCVSGRLKSSGDLVLDDLKTRPLDVEYINLLHRVFNQSIPGFFYKSYSIVTKSGELSRSSPYFCKGKLPLYLIFTSFGTSWLSIVKQLQMFPLFAASLQRIEDILFRNNTEVSVATINDSTANFKDIVGTMTLQIAFVDVLKILGIRPDKYFDLSYGQVLCGYAEGSLSLEETIMSVFRSKRLQESTLTNLTKKGVLLEVGNQGLDTLSRDHHNLSFGRIETICVNFLEILGKLYQFGHTFFIDQLYPKVDYPVSRSTPMISPLIDWNHRKSWLTKVYVKHDVLQTGEVSVIVSLFANEWSYIKEHSIDGRTLFPATGYLLLVCNTYFMITSSRFEDTPIVMENCKFLRGTTLSNDVNVDLTITIQRGSGKFEVTENETVVATGNIRTLNKKCQKQFVSLSSLENQGNKILPLKTKDVYKELKLRGYNYTGEFRRIVECDGAISKGIVRWDPNLITFLDAMLQLKILQSDTRNLHVPTGIRKLTIDSQKHSLYLNKHGENLPVYLHKEIDLIRCGGIEIQGLAAAAIARRKLRSEPVLEKYDFIPNETELTIQDSVRVIMQIILENFPGFQVKSSEVIDDFTDGSEILSSLISEVLGDLPLIQPSVNILMKNGITIPNITIEEKKLSEETECTLVIASHLFERRKVLNQAFKAVKDNAFVLTRERYDFEPEQTNFPDVDILAVHRVGAEKLFLLRKTTPLESAVVIDISNINGEFSWLPVLQKAIQNNPSVIVVAQNEPLSGILGLVNCIRREPGCNHVKTVFTFDGAPVFDLNTPFYSSQLKKNLVVNVYKNSKWGTYRHLLLAKTTEIEKEHVFCDILTRGDLSTLEWLEGPLVSNTILPPKTDLVYVYYSSLNFRDIMCASGRISADVIVKDRTQQQFLQGFEYAGKIKDGRRVMGIAPGALGSLLRADRYFMWTCPDFMSLEEAATIPVVYCTVYYALLMRCKIRRGQSILIHAGSGGIGQAAINVALHYGLTVYTTVGTREKREFLLKAFPSLTDNQIGNSRDTSFEQMIYTQTNGRGVDYVLNSLAEDKLLASVRCLANGGHFLEIGKFDMANDNPLCFMLLEKSASFHGITVDKFFDGDSINKSAIHKLIEDGIQNGAIKPLVRTIFNMNEVEQAFRYMAAGKHIGKVIIQVRQEENEKTVCPAKQVFTGLPRFFCDSNRVYIVIGGLGGFGLELADWLVLRGARNLVLVSRRGVTTGYQAFRIKIWKNYGTRVHISTADITTMQGCQQLVEEASNLGIIESIFNLAVVLKDAIFENQTVDSFKESLAPKAIATKLLDEITRKMCPNLRDFVVFSSISCGRGNAGQSNYGMANSIMERICEKRREDGLPALAIEWGAIGDVGLVAELQEESVEMEIGGTLQQRISNCLQVLDTLLVQKTAVVSSMVVAEKRSGLASNNIVDAVALILGLGDLKSVSLHATLSELGMDSMTAVEIKQTLEREHDVLLTAHDIRKLTFARLKEIQEEKTLEDVSTRSSRILEDFNMIIRMLTDEETSKIPLMQLKSHFDNGESSSKIIFFPGIEGVSKVLTPLAANLNAQVDCLQYISEHQEDTITEMAKNLLPRVEALISKTEPFKILGYSFGAVVALEVVRLLEQKEYVGKFFAIDGAPHMLEKLLKNNFDMQSEAVFQTAFLMHILSFSMPVDMILNNKETFLKCNSFEERLDVAEKIAPKQTTYSIQYLRNFAKAAYLRVKAVNNYKISDFKLKSKVTLFKPQSPSVTDIDEDYKLSEICENAVDINAFKGNHFTILENVKMAEAINAAL